jgi:hypothetical protein
VTRRPITTLNDRLPVQIVASERIEGGTGL